MDLWNTNKFNSQIHNKSLFDRLNVNYCVCKIGSENFPENGISCDYNRDNYSEAYHEIEIFFIHQTQTTFLKPIIDLDMFRTDFNFNIFDLNNQKEKIAAQPIRIEFIFDGIIRANVYTSFALVLSNRLVSVSSDGQRHFDLI